MATPEHLPGTQRVKPDSGALVLGTGTMARMQEAIRHLFRLYGDGQGIDDAHLLRKLTELSCASVDVERAGIWLYDDERQAIVCTDLYERAEDRHAGGTRLEAKTYPAYFAALQQEVVIPAHDAQRDTTTCEFRDGYLIPLGITSMLDAPIWREGRVIGVLCLEHRGPARRWRNAEQQMAATLALFVGLYFERHARLEAERSLRNAQRMEDLGRMAGGIAHDFNNVLTAISGLNEQLLAHADEPQQVRHRARRLQTAVERATALVGSLRDFTHQQAMALEPLDLAEVVQTCAPVLTQAVAGKARLEFACQPQVRVLGERVLLERVLLNLIVNARDAVTADGRILVTVGISAGLQPKAELTVTDDGCGMDEAVKARVFEPWFTTKGVHGSGMGLAIVFDIVHRLHGGIRVESRPGQGACFVVTLPLTN